MTSMAESVRLTPEQALHCKHSCELKVCYNLWRNESIAGLDKIALHIFVTTFHIM